MKSISLRGKTFEWDDTKKYWDFYVDEKGGHLVELDIERLLTAQDDAQFKALIEAMVMLDRWVLEAPRKRYYRELRLLGAQVISDEFFFEDHEDGLQILANLENTGHLARRFLEVFAPEQADVCKNSLVTTQAAKGYKGPLDPGITLMVLG